MSETEDRVYALIDVAGQQQGSVQAALDGLAAERLALQRERQALARGVEAMRQGASVAVRLAVRAVQLIRSRLRQHNFVFFR
jgi:hypothetical protein